MSQPDAWADKKKQAEDYAYVAKSAAETAQMAMDSGDTTKAKEMYATAIEYADMAKQQFAALGTEVKDGDQVFVSQAEAIKPAMNGVEQSSNTKIAALKGMQEAAHSAMEELTSKAGFQDLSKGMDDAEVRWLKNWQTMQAKAIDSINAVEDRIDKMISKDRTVYVNVKETQ